MFCNYCGKPNPDAAEFCASCGKHLTHAASPRAASAAAELPASPAEPRVASPVMPAAAAAPPVKAAPTPKKKRRMHWGLILFALLLLLVLYYPHKDGNTICSATQEEVVEQVPYSIDILAARHPIAVGILRSALNDQGAVDKFAEDYVRASMQSHDPSAVDCYVSYYAILFNKDRFRSVIADWMEKQLNLAN